MSPFKHSNDPLSICPFEKHKDEPWEDVVEEDRRYVEWLISGEGPVLSPALEEVLTNLLEETEEG